jgi:hypothetical protein
MTMRKLIAVFVFAAFAATGCGYIVPPVDDSTPTPANDKGWSAVATGVSEAGGALHVDIAIRNDTGSWSALDTPSSGAVHVSAGGKDTDCATAFVTTGGTSLAPGFMMRGYTTGSVLKPVKQMLYAECAGVAKGSGMTLSIAYTFVTGPYNYYVPSPQIKGTFKLDLDKPVTDIKYPVAAAVPGVIEKANVVIPAINKCTVQLVSAKRTDTGLEFSWESKNPSEYPAFVHIGTPNVIGSDGVLYGFYESPHLATAPISPAGDKAEWTTTVVVPKDVTGLYIMLSVESQQAKFFINHAVDITDK